MDRHEEQARRLARAWVRDGEHLSLSGVVDLVRTAMDSGRRAALEEAAKVVEFADLFWHNGDPRARIAARIRALADAPGAEEERSAASRVTDPAGAATMPCRHAPPCPLPGTRYGEGYCAARSQFERRPDHRAPNATEESDG